MQIQVNSNKNIQVNEELTAEIESKVSKSLSHFESRISRVEVHLSDENEGKKGQNDKRCMMEARLEGMQPTAVTYEANTVAEAVSGAASKLKNSIESTLGRLRDSK